MAESHTSQWENRIPRISALHFNSLSTTVGFLILCRTVPLALRRKVPHLANGRQDGMGSSKLFWCYTHAHNNSTQIPVHSTLVILATASSLGKRLERRAGMVTSESRTASPLRRASQLQYLSEEALPQKIVYLLRFAIEFSAS